jgi:phosphomannomutase
MAIGVYEHSGVARDLLTELLEGLGAEVMRLGRSDRFVPVDTEAIRAEDVLLAREWAYEHDLHAIVSTDGDADRPLIADEQGEWLRGDIVGVLCARYLGVSHIVTPVSSNTVVERSGWFEQAVRTRIGSPYVIAGMRAAEAPGRIVAGYEANGGVLLATDIVRDGRVLGALPTRDAVIGILSVLLAACERKCLVSALVADLPSRHTASNRLQDAPPDVWMSRLQSLASDPGSLRMVFGPVCGDLSSVDTTDGLRVTFANGEIVHLRPSGNAPELRCYNEAGSHMRAGEINQSCMNILSNWH